MANKRSKIIVSRYIDGSGDCVSLVALSKKDRATQHCSKFLVQWGAKVIRGTYYDSGYQGYAFDSFEEAKAHFNTYR